jgi:2-polyprenyl-6-methoxyphenol hydroxylase-like FAD-dependent oxidoreductase
MPAGHPDVSIDAPHNLPAGVAIFLGVADGGGAILGAPVHLVRCGPNDKLRPQQDPRKVQMTSTRLDGAVPARRIPVLIVGGGPVGLALAADLGWRSVPCELIEQTDGAIATPKMNEVNVRTMEFCRRWGIAEQVLNCPFPADYPFDVVFVTSLSGHEIGRMRRPARGKQRPEAYSPMRLQACSQMWFDPILRGFAQSSPSVQLRHRTRLEAFEDNGDGVICDVVDLATGARERVVADYLVGCDGAQSAIRSALGIGLGGQGVLGHPLHLFFRAPGLLEQCGREPGTFFMAIDRDGLWANIRVIDPANALWRLMVLDSDGKQTPETIDKDALIRRAVGRPIEVEWLGLSIWARRSVVADAYGRGRVFLAGDAVHQLSPTGALGMNTGIGDAVDLGWKLAATVQGWGGDQLLASYDAERRPIGHRNVDMAAEFYLRHENFDQGLGAIEEDTESGRTLRQRLGGDLVRDIGAMFRTIGMQIGYRYEGSPIVVPDGTPPVPDNPDEFAASARPGSRAPHAVLQDGRSILDLYGRGFTLVRFNDVAGGSIGEAAKARGVPLRTVAADDPDAAKLYERKLVLVRPDGHVAWRGDREPDNSLAVIDRVRGA